MFNSCWLRKIFFADTKISNVVQIWICLWAFRIPNDLCIFCEAGVEIRRAGRLSFILSVLRIRIQGSRSGIQFFAVLRIHDILGWIRILGSMPLTNRSGSGSGSGSWIRILLFSSLTFKMPAKNLFFNTIFSAYYFLKLNLHHFPKVKSQKE
jgi:hypothetical protein